SCSHDVSCHTQSTLPPPRSLLFLFLDPAPTAIYTLSLHDALPISDDVEHFLAFRYSDKRPMVGYRQKNVFYVLWFDHDFTLYNQDRKSTRLNSSHVSISYAVFCLKKKTRQ